VNDIFPILILNGRPAAGKSEIIDFLKKLPVEDRRDRYHIGEVEEFDDFPILWERFEDDDLFEKNGRPRLISNAEFSYQGETLPGYTFKDRFFWDFLIQKLCFNYEKAVAQRPGYHDATTAVVEFARGSEHGGWKQAYSQLSDAVLERAGVIYIDVSWEESLRKNRRRFNPDKPDSILEHALEDKKIEMLYRDSDWSEVSAANPDFLSIRDHRVPYAVFDNMPEITDQPHKLGEHLREVTDRLWKNRRPRPAP
jgi:hypothetical protein